MNWKSIEDQEIEETLESKRQKDTSQENVSIPTQLENDSAKQLPEIEQMKTCIFPYLRWQLDYDCTTAKKEMTKVQKRRPIFNKE